jgi:hypothetical protein
VVIRNELVRRNWLNTEVGRSAVLADDLGKVSRDTATGLQAEYLVVERDFHRVSTAGVSQFTCAIPERRSPHTAFL